MELVMALSDQSRINGLPFIFRPKSSSRFDLCSRQLEATVLSTTF